MEAEAVMEVWATEKTKWDAGRARFEQEEARWVQLADSMEDELSQWEQELEELSTQAKDQIAAAPDRRRLMQRFDVLLFSREAYSSMLCGGTSRSRCRACIGLSTCLQQRRRCEKPCRVSWRPQMGRSRRTRPPVGFFINHWGPPPGRGTQCSDSCPTQSSRPVSICV